MSCGSWIGSLILLLLCFLRWILIAFGLLTLRATPSLSPQHFGSGVSHGSDSDSPFSIFRHRSLVLHGWLYGGAPLWGYGSLILGVRDRPSDIHYWLLWPPFQHKGRAGSPFVGMSTCLTSGPLLLHHICLRFAGSLALTLSDPPDLSPHGPGPHGSLGPHGIDSYSTIVVGACTFLPQGE